MKSLNWNPVFQGVLSFPVTPFHDNLSLDLSGFQKSLEDICAEEFTSIFVCCGAGEFQSLTGDEYRRLVSSAGQIIGQRKPWFASVGIGQAQAVEFAKMAKEAGAAGVLVMPLYLATTSTQGFVDYYKHLAETCDLDIILYQRDNAIFSYDVLKQLADCPNIIGFKDGTGDLDRFRQFTAQFGQRFAWISGVPTAEITFEAYYACGAAAFSSGLANFAPQIAFDFYRATVDGNQAECTSILNRFVIPLCRIRARKPGYAVSIIKAGMKLMGLPAGPVRPPLEDLNDVDMRDLKSILERNGILKVESLSSIA